MSLYLVKLFKVRKGDLTHIGYLKQGRVVKNRSGARLYPSPSAAIRSADSFEKSFSDPCHWEIERDKPKVTFKVFAGYQSYPDSDLDDRIERAAGKGADGSGMGFFKGGGRDIDFSFKTRAAALASAARIRRLSYGGKKVGAKVSRDEDFEP